MTFLCVMILIAGSLYFVYGKLESDRIKQMNGELSSRFHSGEPAETPEPSQTPSGEGAQTLASESAPPQTDAPVETNAPAQTDAPTLSPTEQPDPSSEAEMDWRNFDPFGLPDVLDVALVTPRPADELQPAFQELYARNSDLIGWIQMGDCVDYPVLWKDNSFYMDHDFYGQYSQAGSIFLDVRNSPDLSDSAMLIYGHNMRSGEMFGDLDRYRDGDYLREYPMITLQSAWESEPRKYVLISLFDASMNKDDPSYIRIVRTSFEDDADKEAFIEEMRSRSMYEIPVDANADDQLLTLVTCSYSHPNGRFLLFARQLREDETKSGIMEQFQAMP